MERTNATAGRRFAGYLLDAVFLSVVVAGPVALLENLIAIDRSKPTADQIDVLPFELIMFVGLIWWAVVVGWIEGGRFQATPGKLVLGMKIDDVAIGGPIGFWRGVLRWLVFFPSVWLVGAGLWPLLSNPPRHAWHDRASRSVVVMGSWRD
jgi:uncharacterized RDD family membrane protein YckC